MEVQFETTVQRKMDGPFTPVTSVVLFAGETIVPEPDTRVQLPAPETPASNACKNAKVPQPMSRKLATTLAGFTKQSYVNMTIRGAMRFLLLCTAVTATTPTPGGVMQVKDSPSADTFTPLAGLGPNKTADTPNKLNPGI